MTAADPKAFPSDPGAFPREELSVSCLKDRIQVLESELNAARVTASDLALLLNNTRIALGECQGELKAQRRVTEAHHQLIWELFARVTK